MKSIGYLCRLTSDSWPPHMRTSEYEFVCDMVFELGFSVEMVLGAPVGSPLGYSMIMMLGSEIDCYFGIC